MSPLAERSTNRRHDLGIIPRRISTAAASSWGSAPTCPRAAVRLDDDSIMLGALVENVSLGLAMCGERVAFVRLGLRSRAEMCRSFAPAEADAQTKPTLADILLSDSAKDGPDGFDHRSKDYDIVTQAVLLFPDLVAAASDPNAQLTVFLPNDGAFRRLVHDVTGKWYRSEADVFNAVASLGTDTVKQVLQYHRHPVLGRPAVRRGQARHAPGRQLDHGGCSYGLSRELSGRSGYETSRSAMPDRGQVSPVAGVASRSTGSDEATSQKGPR